MGDKKEKKVKIEISKMALIFTILFSLSLLIWSFVIGVWVGTKIGVKPEKEEIAMEEEGISFNESVPSRSAISNETLPPPSVKITPPPVIKETPEKKSTSISTTKKTEKKKGLTAHKKPIKYQKPFYSIQIGAFSKKEIALRFKKMAKAKGYYCFMRKLRSNGKVLYKVYVGKYSTRDQAKNFLSKIAKNLNVEKPFVVKIK